MAHKRRKIKVIIKKVDDGEWWVEALYPFENWRKIANCFSYQAALALQRWLLKSS